MRNSFMAILALLILGATIVSGQEPTYMDAATHPGAGQFYTRLLVAGSEFSGDDEDFDRQRVRFKLSYGIRSTLALLADADYLRLDRDDGSDSGFSEAKLRMKYQLYRADLSPVNTWRTSLIGGAALPGTDSEVAPSHASPLLSLVSTAVLGRHGLNAEVGWRGQKRDDDIFDIKASHLFRLAPRTYTAHTRGAWYTMLESLNKVSDRSDVRYDAAAGLLYEAQIWAAEISYRRTLGGDWINEIEHEVTIGARLLF